MMKLNGLRSSRFSNNHFGRRVCANRELTAPPVTTFITNPIGKFGILDKNRATADWKLFYHISGNTMGKQSKKNFYVVRNGRKTGIFDSWDECKAQVEKFPNNNQEGFYTLEEAEAAWQRHLNSQSATLNASTNINDNGVQRSQPETSERSRNSTRIQQAPTIDTSHGTVSLQLRTGAKRKFDEADVSPESERILGVKQKSDSNHINDSTAFSPYVPTTTTQLEKPDTSYIDLTVSSPEERSLIDLTVSSPEEKSLIGLAGSSPDDASFINIEVTASDDEKFPLPKRLKFDNDKSARYFKVKDSDFEDDKDTLGFEDIPASIKPPVESTPVKLTAEQSTVVKMAVRGDNIFLTGAAGCGKTVTLRQILERLKRKHKDDNVNLQKVQVVAPTGLAALPLNGKTTYSFAGWKPHSLKLSLDKLLDSIKKKTIKELHKLEVLIIEEISMVENQFLERLNCLLKTVRESGRPFGGVQVIFLGDFYQLPPVKPFENCMLCGREMVGFKERICKSSICVDRPDNISYKPGDKWAFKAKVWEQLNFKHVKLEQIHRQKDEKFKDLLNKVRNGIALNQAEWEALTRPKTLPPAAFPIRLMSRRIDVERFNKAQLDSIKTELKVWESRDDACPLFTREDDHLRRDEIRDKEEEYKGSVSEWHRFPRELTLKLGAKVVLLYNQNPKKGLVNGSQGTIVSFINAENWPTEVTGDHCEWRQEQLDSFMAQNSWRPVVRFADGKTATIAPVPSETLMGTADDRYLVCRTQIPLMLAWALSIHKSQGMTMEYVDVSRKDIFESGQLYVALSRATSIDGLTVTGYSREEIGMDPDVVEFYKNTEWENLQSE